jgi:glutamyl-tRNA synthetase
MNGTWIRSLTIDDLYSRCTSYFPESAASADVTYKKAVLGLVQERLKYFAEIPELTSFFFEEPAPNLSLITENKQLKKFELGELKTLLEKVHESLKDTDFTAESVQETLNTLLETTGQKPGVLFSLVRIATTWAPFSPNLAESLAVLGKETSLDRIEKATQIL